MPPKKGTPNNRNARLAKARAARKSTQSTEPFVVSLEDKDVVGPLVETPAPSPLPSPVKHDILSRRARRARSTPSKSPRKTFPPRAQGARRAVPCAGCVRSAIAGRSTGECFDNKSGGDRCFRCASGHTCRALSSAAASACIKFVNARINNAPKNRINILRAAARVALEEKDELGSDIDANLPDKKPVLKKKPKDDSDSEDGGTGFGGGMSEKQMAMDAYNTLMKVLAK